MPELPEVKAHAERLAEAFAGLSLARFEPLHPAALKTFEPRPSVVAQHTLAEVSNRGKYLLMRFEPPDRTQAGVMAASGRTLVFVVHLMQAGRLREDLKQARKPRGGMARWVFDEASALLLSEAGTERRVGVWLLASDPADAEPLARLGPDADRIGRDDLAQRLTSCSERVHGFLRDQRHLAGIGRLLANEILHDAKISPFARTDKLDGDAVARLHSAMGATIARQLDSERSLADMGRSAARPNDVHHRVGKPCKACGDVIRAVEYRRYRVAYCASCQTGGRVLADNTTSRFLK